MSRSPSPSMSWIWPAVPMRCAQFAHPSFAFVGEVPVPSLMSRKSLAVPPPLLTR